MFDKDALFHGALQENCQIAVWLDPSNPALQFKEDKHSEMPATYTAAAVHPASPSVPRATPAVPPSSITVITTTVFEFEFGSVRFGGNHEFDGSYDPSDYGGNIRRITASCHGHNCVSRGGYTTLLQLFERHSCHSR